MTQLGKIPSPTLPRCLTRKLQLMWSWLYMGGAQAIMVFDQTFSEEENKQKIEGELNVMVKMIPNGAK